MCSFLSVIEDGAGKIYYQDWKIRKSSAVLDADIHVDIANRFGISEYNSYDYDPWKQSLRLSSIVLDSQADAVLEECMDIDMNTVCPVLSFNAFQVPPKNTVDVTTMDKHMLFDYAVQTTKTDSRLNLIDHMDNVDMKYDVLSMLSTLSIDATDAYTLGFVSQGDFTVSGIALAYSYHNTALKCSAWKQVNEKFLPKEYINKLWYLDIDKNPYYATEYFWSRGLFPEYYKDLWALRNFKGTVVYEIKDYKLMRMCPKVKRRSNV